jgi:hypothetical protein
LPARATGSLSRESGLNGQGGGVFPLINLGSARYLGIVKAIKKHALMRRFIIPCCLVFLVLARVPAQSVSGTANNPKQSAHWATPNEIRAVSLAISLADMPMTFSKIRTDVLGGLGLCPIYGAGGANGWSDYWAITDISGGKPYYGIVFRHKEITDDPEVGSMQLYYCDEHGMTFYHKEDEAVQNMHDDLKKTTRQLNKTPWQMGSDMARMWTDFAQSEYIKKDSLDKKALVAKKYPTPFIDAQADSVIYPPEAKVPEPNKAAKAEVVYPLELRRSAISGKVVLCIKVNKTGCPARIGVKESTNDVFVRYAIARALQTTWESNTKNNGRQEAWFESEVVFDITK